MKPGDRHYKAFVGPLEWYDMQAARQFVLLTGLGLKSHHKMLDIGCGSLRSGKLFIPYLAKGNYYGVEPEEWLVREGIENEIGWELIKLKDATIRHTSEYDFDFDGVEFDFILAHSIFTHASKEAISLCLHNAEKTMHQDSIFMASYQKGRDDYDGNEWVYPGCVSYRLETMQALAKEHGLKAEPYVYHLPDLDTFVNHYLKITKEAR